MKEFRINVRIMTMVILFLIIFSFIGKVWAEDQEEQKIKTIQETQVPPEAISFLAKQTPGSESKPALIPQNTTGPLNLTLAQFVDLVSKRNERILSQKAGWVIKQEEVTGARSIFEPELVGNYKLEDNRQRNSTDEILGGRNESVFEERNEYYDVGLESLLPTGARLNLGYYWKEISNTSTRKFSAASKEYRQVPVVSLTQPLLKNAGIKTTMSQIRVAESNADVALQDYRQEMIGTVANAVSIYWELLLAQERVEMRKESVRVANQILEDNRARVRTGKMAEIEVVEAEAGVALRKSLESEAEQELVSVMNGLRTMFSSSAATSDRWIKAADPLLLENREPDYKTSLEKAFLLKPEYLSSRMKVEQEDIRLAFAKNQMWPQLDLKASYALNGYGFSNGSAWDEVKDGDFDSWSVGVELRIPILGGLKSKSEKAVVEQRKRQALLELKAVEIALTNAVDTTVKNIYSVAEQANYSSYVVDFNRRLLEVELAKIKAGKSNSRLVLEKEEDFRQAKEDELEALVNHKKAVIDLEVIQGTLLARYDIDVMEVEQ